MEVHEEPRNETIQKQETHSVIIYTSIRFCLHFLSSGTLLIVVCCFKYTLGAKKTYILRWWWLVTPTNIVDGAVSTSQQQKRARRVKRSHRAHLLALPVLSHGVPHADPAHWGKGDQLVADEEQVLYWHAQLEGSWVGRRRKNFIDNTFIK